MYLMILLEFGLLPFPPPLADALVPPVATINNRVDVEE